jgi:hypothetical protein
MEEINGKKYYSQEEVENEIEQQLKIKRRESDKIIGEFFDRFNTSLEFFTRDLQGHSRAMGEVGRELKAVTIHLEKHDAIIHGNGHEGMVTTMSKSVSTLEAICEDVWHKEKGLPAINAKLDVLMEKKKDYDKVCQEVADLKEIEIPKMKGETGKVKGKINTITAIWGIVSGIAGFIIGKIADAIIAGRIKPS